MGYRYASRKGKATDAPQAGQAAAKAASQTPGVPMETTRSMLMGRAMEDRSHRIDLPTAMREKMETAFGMDFGKVNIYESEKVADAGAQAIAQGGNIAFAPGEANFSNLTGQSLLGHELSHIAAQARGEVTGSGFLDNGALEARADREGALAASGEQVYSGPMMDAPSFAGASAPMQAKLPPAVQRAIDQLPADLKKIAENISGPVLEGMIQKSKRKGLSLEFIIQEYAGRESDRKWNKAAVKGQKDLQASQTKSKVDVQKFSNKLDKDSAEEDKKERLDKIRDENQSYKEKVQSQWDFNNELDLHKKRLKADNIYGQDKHMQEHSNANVYDQYEADRKQHDEDYTDMVSLQLDSGAMKDMLEKVNVGKGSGGKEFVKSIKKLDKVVKKKQEALKDKPKYGKAKFTTSYLNKKYD